MLLLFFIKTFNRIHMSEFSFIYLMFIFVIQQRMENEREYSCLSSSSYMDEMFF